MAYASGSSQGPALAILKAVSSTMQVQEVWRTEISSQGRQVMARDVEDEGKPLI